MNKVETVFSFLRRRFGVSLNARKYRLYIKEIKMKMIVNNLSKIITSFVILKIVERFYRAKKSKGNQQRNRIVGQKGILHIIGWIIFTLVEISMTEELTEKMLSDANLFPWWLLLLWGILSLLIGIMFLTTPGMTTVLFITFIGAYWLVGGLFTLCSLAVDKTNMGWKIFLSVINILAGILILAYPLYSTIFVLSFFVIFLGFWACFIGAAHLFQAFSAKDAGNGVLGIVSLIFGILLLINPFFAAELLPILAGAFGIVAGFAAIIVSFTVKKAQAA
jgi:uncharacterized membrane protein HdeD (DUF308 family)